MRTPRFPAALAARLLVPLVLFAAPWTRGGEPRLDEWGEPVRYYTPDPWIEKDKLRRARMLEAARANGRPAAEWRRHREDMAKAVAAVNAAHGVTALVDPPPDQTQRRCSRPVAK